MRFFYSALLVHTLLMTACTSNKLSNNHQDLVMDCGQVETEASYAKIYNDRGEEFAQGDLEVFSVSSGFTPLTSERYVTSKGCVKLQPNEVLFVRNKTKTLGMQIDFHDTFERRKLKPIASPFEKIQVGCDSLVYSDGQRFLLKLIDLKENPSSIQLNLALFEGETGPALHTWPQAKLASLMEYAFIGIQVSDFKEYILKARLTDPITSTEANIKCRLRNDESKVQIALANKIGSRVKYLGREFLTVDPGYTINFYAQAGFKDINAEYCAVRLDFESLNKNQWPQEDCAQVKSLLFDEAVTLQDGLWMVRYRGLRGQLEGAWHTDYVLVDKVCVGRYTDPKSILKDRCTKILGGIRFADVILETEDMATVSQLHSVLGDISFNFIQTTSHDFQIFKHLNRIDGSLIFESSTLVDVSGFENLESIGGDLEFLYNTQGNVRILSKSGFSNLNRIGGTLHFIAEEGHTELSGFTSLDEVGHLKVQRTSQFSSRNAPVFPRDLAIKGDLVLVESAANFKSLNIKSIGGGLWLKGTETASLSGLEYLEKLDYLTLENEVALESLNGLDRLKSVGRVQITGNQVLTDVSLKGLQTANSMELAYNQALKSIDFQSLESGEVTLSDNTKLETLAPFLNFRSGRLTLCGSPDLRAAPQLPSGHQVSFTACPAL